MWPYNEDLIRFDFETDKEHDPRSGNVSALLGTITPPPEKLISTVETTVVTPDRTA
jgi:hypothetical protein